MVGTIASARRSSSFQSTPLFKSDSAYILAPRRRRSAAALPWLRPRSRGLPERSISGKGA